MRLQEAETGAVATRPLTPEMRVRLVKQSKIDVRFVVIGVMAAVVIAYAAFPRAVSWFLQSTASMIIGGICLALTVYLPILWSRLQLAADLKSGQYSRYSGVFVIRRYGQPAHGIHPDYWPLNRSFTWALQLPSGEIVVPSPAVAAMERAGRGSIDFATNSRTVFEVRDSQGAVLFRHSGLSD